ncbi:MAG: HpcH/HpaI aldolase family protein [Gammaproteobacteria bacterium]
MAQSTHDDPVKALRDKLDRDEPLIVVNADHPSASLVEVLAQLPIDVLFIDCEQGSPDVESVENMARAARLHALASVVRVFSPQPWVLERYLFRGVDGVVVPRVDHAEDAQRVVDGVRYCFPRAPQGKFVAVQIESQSAVDELDAFLQVDGIDAFFIGPVDLAKSMGYEGDFRVPAVQRAMDDVIARTRAAGRHVGILVDDDNVAEYCRKGVRFLYTHANAFISVGACAFAARCCDAGA